VVVTGQYQFLLFLKVGKAKVISQLLVQAKAIKLWIALGKYL
jgi:hypothetical protein